MIVIIIYKMGNLGSIANMIKRISYGSLVKSDKFQIESPQKVILPSIMNIDKAMQNIDEMRFYEII
jgi:imidazole glycerol-phosphate synthase subunit HisH